MTRVATSSIHLSTNARLVVYVLIVTSDKGEVALVKASPDAYTEVARFEALKGQTWNYPALASGRLLVRNSTEMAAYDISAK